MKPISMKGIGGIGTFPRMILQKSSMHLLAMVMDYIATWKEKGVV